MAATNKPSAISLNDTESRQWLQTKTQSGHNWDQVLGVSQRIINKNFQRLFELYPTMSDMYNTDDKASMIDAKLSPPQILIPGGNSSVSRSEVLFQLRFESGAMMDSNGVPIIEDMTGWVITSPVKVDRKKATVTENMSPEAKAKTLKENDWIDRFDVAGAYSAERLYAKLSSIRWGQFDVDHTYCGLDEKGEKISFQNWAAADDSRFLRLTTWLLDWSYKQDLAGRNNIGVSFQLPPAENVNEPTYEPVFMMNQTYPYISGPQNALEGATGSEGAGGCNAFLYTEVVKIPGLPDTRRPDDHTLVWSGNFCTLPTTVDGKDAIDGTFVMGRNVFLETFLLPELWPLNKATDICHGKPYGEQKDERVWCYTPYSLGYDSQHPSFKDDIFKFSNVNDNNDPEKPNGYRWTKINVQGPEFHNNKYSERGDLRAEVKDEMTVDVTWVSGTQNIKIAGKAFSKENCIWNRSYEPPKSWDNLWAWIRDEYTVTFDFELVLSTRTGKNGNGILDINVQGGNGNTKVNVGYKKDQHNIEQDGHRDDFYNQIVENFKEVIPRMVQNLKIKLEGGGNFVFPGNGVFDFSEPMLGRYGHLLTRVDYKPLKQNQKLFVPRPPKLLNRIGVKPPTQNPVMDANQPKWHLEWTRTDPVPAALQKSKIWLRGTNVDPKLWCEFKQINIQFTSGTKGRNLFAEDNWALEAAPGQGAKESGVDGGNIPPTATSTSTTAADEKTEPVASALPTTTATAAEQVVAKDSTSNSEATREATKLPTETSKETTADDAVLVERPAETAAGEGTAQPQRSSGILDKIGNLLSGSSSNTDPLHGPLPQPQPTQALETTKTGTVTETKVAALGGVITLRQKLTGPDMAILKAPNKVGGKWLVLLDTSGTDGVLRLGPGDWVEVGWEGRVGPAGTYALTVNEDWNETVQSYFRADVKVAVSAPATAE